MVAWVSSGWLHHPRRPLPHIWPSAAPLLLRRHHRCLGRGSTTAEEVCGGAELPRHRGAIGGHEVEPCRRTVAIRPPLTPRSTAGWVYFLTLPLLLLQPTDCSFDDCWMDTENSVSGDVGMGAWIDWRQCNDCVFNGVSPSVAMGLTFA